MLEKNSTIVQKYFQSTFKEVSLFEWSHHRFLVTNSTVRTSVHETSSFTLAMKWSSKCVSPRFSKAFRRLCYMPDDTNTSIRIPLLFSGTSNIYVSIY